MFKRPHHIAFGFLIFGPMLGVGQPVCQWPQQVAAIADPDIVKINDEQWILSGTGPRMHVIANEPGRFPCNARTKPIDIVFEGSPDQHPWDVGFHWHRVEKKWLVSAASMRPKIPGDALDFHRDNVRRRSFFYDVLSLVTGVSSAPGPFVVRRFPLPIRNNLMSHQVNDSWLGHSYGRSILWTDDQTAFVYYEMGVTSASPHRTCIFGAKLEADWAQPTQPPVQLVCPGSSDLKAYPSETREWAKPGQADPPALVEGPRIFAWNGYYLLFYSASDFCSDRYVGNVAWSKNPLGPFTKVLTSDGADVLNILAPFKKDFSWLGRPHVFEHDGQLYLLFHGEKRIAGLDYSKCPWSNLRDHRVTLVHPIKSIKVEPEFKIELWDLTSVEP